ncbi:hypothetical protein ACFQZO_11770 [Bradyrhizobium sp. GCM10027634]|uniref:hypothetical protein n=1 Tax=unclassified Bradyrhizobium TaxID=2631580 RepID=UPI00188C3C52|nr:MULTISPECIES: hypothetical protein [unclassified Bradyrhizobium]MDN5001562.1 hypothetical protein [Bradyrhizobium sp. WYCCWR 12677]
MSIINPCIVPSEMATRHKIMSSYDAFALAFKVAERRAASTQKAVDAIACVTFSGLTGVGCR